MGADYGVCDICRRICANELLAALPLSSTHRIAVYDGRNCAFGVIYFNGLNKKNPSPFRVKDFFDLEN